MSDDSMTDEEYLIAVRKAREESVRYWDNANKADRERWVVSEFLENLGLSFEESQIQSVPESERTPDVRFRSAEFEVKEIQDEGRRRHAEYKAALERANAATTPQELLEPVTPRDATYAEICDRVEHEVARFAQKYAAAATRASLDLLFYVNLDDVFGYIATPLPPPSRWQSYGFRSISVVMGRMAGVLAHSDHAPDFLKDEGPRIRLKPRP